MLIDIVRVDNAFRMKVTNENGFETFVDASESIGGAEQGFRPMQLLLTSLATCSGIDVIHILRKQRQQITDFRIKASGQRKDGTPSPFTHMTLEFILTGKIKERKLEQALELAKSKYCSAVFSLHPDIEINYTYSIVPAS